MDGASSRQLCTARNPGVLCERLGRRMMRLCRFISATENVMHTTNQSVCSRYSVRLALFHASGCRAEMFDLFGDFAKAEY